MKFRQRVEAVIEKFNDMREDLDRERKFMGKQWSKREAQILAVVDSTVGMVGDLQGIAGKAMRDCQPRHTVARGVNRSGSESIGLGRVPGARPAYLELTQEMVELAAFS